MSDSGNVQSQDGGGSHGEETTSRVPTPNVGNRVTVVLGAQWGDEGKGKVVDLLAQDADIVCRCQVVHEHHLMFVRMCLKTRVSNENTFSVKSDYFSLFALNFPRKDS